MIPAGADQATFVVAAYDNAAVNGTRDITLRASAAAFTDGVSKLAVTDENKAELTVGNLSAPPDNLTESYVTVNYQINNLGTVSAAGPYFECVILSKDQSPSADDIFLRQVEMAGELAAGASYTRNVSVLMPRTTGTYYVIVIADYGNAVRELNEGNNTAVLSQPIEVRAAYSAAVLTASEIVPANTPILFTGSATKDNGSPAAIATVSIHIKLNDTERIISAITNSLGKFSVTWHPLRNEGGTYTIGATHPGVSTAVPQDSFEILTISIDAPPTVNMHESDTVVVQATVRNPNGRDLHGLAMAASGTPAGLSIRPTVPNATLAANGDMLVPITVSTDAGFSGYGSFPLTVTTTEGVRIQALIYVNISLLTPSLSFSVGSLEGSALREGSKSVSLTVSNTGGLETGPVQVLLPAVPWMSLACTSPMPSIPPGDAADVTLLLAPDATVPLSLYTGSIAFNPANGAGRSLGFQFRVVSSLSGNLTVDVVDELFFFTAAAPKLEGAQVVVRDAVTSSAVASITTGVDGTAAFGDLPEGWYRIEVSAAEHDSYSLNYYLNAGQNSNRQVFISKQLVKYSWKVEEVAVQDVYRVSIDTKFETNVPVPVVTAMPSSIDVADLVALGQSKIVNITLENHGLIAAGNSRFRFTEHPFYSFTPLVSNIGTIPAMSSLVVPITVRRTGIFGDNGEIVTEDGGTRGKMPKRIPASGTSVPCSAAGFLDYDYLCGNLLIEKFAAIAMSSVQGNCGDRGFIEFATYLGVLFSQGPDHGWIVPVVGAYNARFSGGFYDGIQSELGGEWSPSNYDHVGGFTGGFYSRGGAWVGGSVSYVNPTATGCPCFDKLCVTGDKKVKLGAIGDAISEALSAALPPWISIENFDFVVQTSGELCFCCVDGSYGLSGNGTAKAFVSGTGVIGRAWNGEVSVDTPGWTEVTAEASALIGAQIGISGEFGIEIEQECGEKGTICAVGSVQLDAFAGVDLNGEVSASYSIPNTNIKVGYTGTATGRLGISGFARASVKGCMDGALKFEACASLKPEAILQLELRPVNGTVEGEYPAQASFGGSLALPSWSAGNCSDTAQLAQMSERVPKRASPEPISFDVPGDEYLLSDREVVEAELVRRSNPSGVCAQVGIQLSQDVVMTRSAFRATLDLKNSRADGPITQVGFNMQIRDEFAQPSEDIFNIAVTRLSGLVAIDGTGEIPASAAGSAQWELIPRDTAAQESDKRYTVGGVIHYVQNGTEFNIPVADVPITVKPDASLVVKYFHQRDVFADDPHTATIEPSIPFKLAVMVENNGYGDANNLRITSGQPQIVDNEKGLFVGYKVIATEVDGAPLSPSLAAEFGTLSPGQTKIATWYLTSSVQGMFTDYAATFKHISVLGDTRLSLIEDLEIHEMIRMVRAQGALDDGAPDFLTNDVKDVNSYPDTIHFSNGGTDFVTVRQNGTYSGTPSPDNVTITLDTGVFRGWSYIRLPDPAMGNYRLVSATRNDGRVLPMDFNVWQSDRTFIGVGRAPLSENILHLVDNDSSGIYTLVYALLPAPDTTPPSSSVNPLPPLSTVNIPVSWSGTDNQAVSHYDVYVSENGGAYDLWKEGSIELGALFVGNIGSTYNFYSVATDIARNRETKTPKAEATTKVTVINQAPVIAAIGNRSVNEGEGIAVQVRADDPDGPRSAIRLSIQSDRPGVALDPTTGLIRWNTSGADGGAVAHVVVTATDSGIPAATTSEAFTIVVDDVNNVPSITQVGPQTIEYNGVLIVDTDAADGDSPAQTLSFALLEAPAGATIETVSGIVKWTPNASQAGRNHLFTVTVTDNGGSQLSSSMSFSVTVLPLPDHAPVFTRVPVVLWLKGKTYSLSVVASDPDGDPISLTANTSATVGAVFTDTGNGSGTLSWNTTSAGVGTYQVPVTATAKGLSTTAILRIKVENNELYWQWVKDAFGDLPDGYDVSLLNMDGDPDGDGRGNVHEMALLTNPLVPDSVPLKVGVDLDGAFATIHLNMYRRVGSDQYVELDIAASEDMSGPWQTANKSDWTAYADAAGDDDGRAETEEIDFYLFELYPSKVPARKFYRVESTKK
jgi:hypothetical protein